MHMELDQVIRKRKMIGAYQRRDIPDRLIYKLIDNASRAPSAGHTQVQEFIESGGPCIVDSDSRTANPSLV